ncbi:MAG: DUF3426 domain-containing protein [Pseudomonadota bacterium]
MYTQCPECEAAFRVTAEVLKQAAGMVRCGSCGHAFNSLAYLSEQKPAPKIPDPSIPELRPESGDEPPPSKPERTNGPQAISAEQSAALLKTLDQLAGDDIRIEDTGVEWRVLDEKDVDDGALAGADEQVILSDPEVTNAFHIDDSPDTAEPSALQHSDVFAPSETAPAELRHGDVFEPTETYVDEQGLFGDQATAVDELLDEAPTPVDEFLAAEPQNEADAVDVDLGALLDELQPDDNNAIQAELDALPDTAVTGTVDDVNPTVDTDEVRATDESDIEVETIVGINAVAVDLPDTEPEPIAEAVQATPQAAEPELRFDDNTPLPEDFLSDDSAAPEMPVGDAAEPVASPDPEALQQDIELGKADEWQALLDEFGDLLATDLGSDDDSADKSDADWAELGEDAVDEELSRELELLEIDDDSAPDADEPAEPLELDASDADEPAEPVELDAADAPVGADTNDNDHDLAETSADMIEETADAIADAAPDDGATAVASANDEAEVGVAETLYDGEPLPVDDDGGLDLTGILDPDDDGLEDHGESDADANESALPTIIDVGDQPVEEPAEEPVDQPGPDDPHYVPPQSEEEQTINRLIDQDLLAIAHEDDEGFTSTIVFEQGADPTDVDSIIMGADDDDRPANDDEPADSNSEEVVLESESIDELSLESTLPPPTASASPENRMRTIGLGVIAALLILALGAQAVHKKRSELAADPRFGSAVQAVYSAVGMPVVPEWDVSGWQIDKTQEATDETGRLLTISAQVSNQSADALPHPILTVSVTDRYQESLGSVVVNPAEYLADAAQAATRVPGGDRFLATIRIAELSENAWGYQLNACYRQVEGPLRCVKRDFR